MEEYNSPGLGTTIHNVTISGSPTWGISQGADKMFTYQEPLPFNVDFPTSNANKFYYAVGFYETVDNFFGFTPVEKITVINPTEYVDAGFFSLMKLSIQHIIYRRGNVNGFTTAGIFNPAGSDVFAGKYYEYVDVEIYAQKDWDFEIIPENDGKVRQWPAPIVRSNNTLRVYTPKNNPPSQTTFIKFTFSNDDLKQGKATTGNYGYLNTVASKTNNIGSLKLQWNKA